MSSPELPSQPIALFLDVDGTLVEIQDRPETVRADEALLSLLEQLERLTERRLVLISGRQIDDIDRIVAPLKLPAAGSHGGQWRSVDGELDTVNVDGASLASLREAMDEQTERWPGTWIEQKPMSMALHYRAVADAKDPLGEALRDIVDRDPDFKLMAGKMVYEIKPQGVDKGRAIERYLNDPLFFDATPVFIGDDVTDEDGFKMINDRQGLSIRVGGRDGSAACWELENVTAVHRWLSDLANHLER
ncbi:MAG: trehalose-phosphatase [Geminicoccaceae bacterium]